jgi:parvulin-like peptidyl-prolyl isomerase
MSKLKINIHTIKRQVKLQYIYLLIPIILILFANGCQKIKGGKVIAKVNDEAITEAEFVQALPKGFASDSIEQKYRRSLIDQIIVKRLFAQEAKRLGLDKEIDPVFERDMKTILIQALYNDVVTKNVKVSPKEIDEAMKLVATEVHLKIIAVPDSSTAQMVSQELAQGIPFDSLAKMYSQDQSGQHGGDIGFYPVFYLEAPVREALLKMKPGETSKPIRCEQDYKIVSFVESQKSTEPQASLRDNARRALEQEKSQKLAMDYLDKMNKRLEYNPEGLKIFYKPVDSITAQEGEIWVVKKDKRKVVYAKNLLQIARQFPVSLDTAMRSYAVRREIEDDVLYEDALARKLDKNPETKTELEKRISDLLYEKFYLNEITQKIDVTEKEIEDYYNANKAKFENSKLAEATPLIRNEIFTNKRQSLYQTTVEGLKSKAKIVINEPLVLTVGKVKINKSNKPGGK